MKIKLLFFILSTVLILPGYALPDNAKQHLSKDKATIPLTDNSTLILYYSKFGKTEIVAKEIQSLIHGSKLVEVKSDVTIPAAIFWYKFPFTKADIEPLNINFDDFDQIFLCTPVYLQGISPPAKAIIKDIPMKGKKVAVFAICGGFYGSFMHWFVKRSIKSKGAEVQGLYVTKVGGKTNEEIEAQAAMHLKTILEAE